MRLLTLASLCLLLAGCGALPVIGTRDPRPAEPLPFETRLLAENGSSEFAVSVADGGAGLAATRESVRFAGTRYCLTRFGFSDIAWDAPAGAPQQWTAQATAAGTTVYSGTCIGR